MPLKVYNSLTRQKEIFTPINPPYVGMYVCGPTVSGESHLGHARPYITFDVLYRYLMHLGYKVRYVRNLTDAGHFEEEGREAEDKISKKAVVEKIGLFIDLLIPLSNKIFAELCRSTHEVSAFF